MHQTIRIINAIIKIYISRDTIILLIWYKSRPGDGTDNGALLKALHITTALVTRKCNDIKYKYPK